MNFEEALTLVTNSVEEVAGEKNLLPEAALIGSSAVLDSMRLVELCLTLEDKAMELEFDFNWASESVMSRSKSMFRTISSLAEEFANQSVGK